MVSAKEKSGNSTNLLRVKKGLRKKKKKKAFELDVDACMIIYDPTLVDVALQREEGFLFNFEIEEDLMKNEFMGFEELNVKINQMSITEEENLLDSSSSLEFLMEGDNCSWPSDELDEILNDFISDNTDDHHQENMFDLLLQSFLDSFSEFLVEEGDIWPPSDELNEIVNGFDHNQDDDDNMFDQLSPLSELPPLPLTNEFIDNMLFNTSTSDNNACRFVSSISQAASKSSSIDVAATGSSTRQ